MAMSDHPNTQSSRRNFMKASLAGAASVAMLDVGRFAHAAGSDVLQVALIGCGGRGTGAAANALATTSGPIKLVAAADVFEDRLASSLTQLGKECPDKVDVPKERQFIGFDGYRKAMDCLRPGDIAILATPPAFRWPQFGYAIEKSLHTFMEKPTTVDGPTTRKMLALADASVTKNLKVGVGLMSRHSNARRELIEQLRDGRIGDIISIRTYRMHGPVGSFASGPKPDDISELQYQIRRFHSFLWASGGCYSDFYIHSIDECCWMKDAWAIDAQGLGGRHYRGNAIDQNFDAYAVEHTFPDGSKMLLCGRTMPGCFEEFENYLHGSKGMARISGSGNIGRCEIFKGQKVDPADIVWKSKREPSPYQLEWDEFVEAIRQDKPYNEARRGAEASLVTSMGRMATHTGQVITYDQILNCNHEFAPQVAELTLNTAAPLQLGPDGKYPVPQPGIVTQREYS